MSNFVRLTAALLAGCIMVGFSLDNAIVPKDHILSGGPPKDGIPAIMEPHFITSHKVDFLKDNDPVIGIVIGKVARAYPISILNWHEVVNDTIKGVPLVVTF